MANTKEELLKEAEKFEIKVDSNIPYNDLLKLVSEKRKEIEVVKTEVEKQPDFILLISEIEHDVARILDVKKGISLFKFGRVKGKEIIPTRVPVEFAKALLNSYPKKYKEVELSKEAKKDVDEYLKTLIVDQDFVDSKKEEEKIKAAIKEQEEKLAALKQQQGQVKQIVRE